MINNLSNLICISDSMFGYGIKFGHYRLETHFELRNSGQNHLSHYFKAITFAFSAVASQEDVLKTKSRLRTTFNTFSIKSLQQQVPAAFSCFPPVKMFEPLESCLDRIEILFLLARKWVCFRSTGHATGALVLHLFWLMTWNIRRLPLRLLLWIKWKWFSPAVSVIPLIWLISSPVIHRAVSYWGD